MNEQRLRELLREAPVPDATVEGTTNAREGHRKNRNRG